MTKARYSPTGQFEGEQIVGFSLAGLSDSEIASLACEVNAKMQPMPSRTLIQKLAIMHAGMASRNAEQVDLEAKFLSYAEDLADLPEFALMEAMREIKRTETFFPASAEIRKLAEAKSQAMRTAHTALNYRPTQKVERRGGMRQIGPRATPEFVTEQMTKFKMAMAAKDAEVQSDRKPIPLKAIPVHNPETAAMIAEARAKQTEAA